MQISEIFEIIQGHQITDEEIYMSMGEYPIYTGNNEIKGYWDKTIVDRSMLPCLTYPTKAFAGKISLQNELFDANNTAVLYLKDEFKNDENINLEWFKYSLPIYFMKKMTSKEGVSYLNRDIVKDINIDIPSINIQNRQIKLYKEIENQEKKLNQLLEIVENALNKHLILEEDYLENEVPISSILSYISRNDSLSEEGIYKMYPRNEKTAKVLSGSTDNIIYGEIDGNLDSIHYLKEQQALHLVTRGKAGKLTYIPKGTYATNTNAFLLYIKKDKWKDLNIHNELEEEIFLKYIKIYLQPKFFSVISNSDVSVFPLTEIMKNLFIPKMTYKSNYINITKIIDLLEEKKNKIYDILNYLLKIRDQMLSD